VIDALTTLAFDYPPRAAYFRGELENYLLIARETVLLEADVKGDAFRAYIDGGVQPRHPLAELAKAGVAAKGDAPPEARAVLIELESPGRPSDYRIGFDNFYVLTRYNRSSFYATAVNDLAAAIKAAQPGGR
jgi:membrane-bound lytic murein transglycosylase B